MKFVAFVCQHGSAVNVCERGPTPVLVCECDKFIASYKNVFECDQQTCSLSRLINICTAMSSEVNR